MYYYVVHEDRSVQLARIDRLKIGSGTRSAFAQGIHLVSSRLCGTRLAKEERFEY